MGWDGCDAVGEVLREGDLVKILRTQECHTDKYVGDVRQVHTLEPLDYDGFSELQVLVDFGGDVEVSGWVNHMWVLKV